MSINSVEIVRLEKEAVAEIEILGGKVEYADKSQPILPFYHHGCARFWVMKSIGRYQESI